MFRIAIYVYPDRDVQPVIQHDDKVGAPTEALDFYKSLREPIASFTEKIQEPTKRIN